MLGLDFGVLIAIVPNTILVGDMLTSNRYIFISILLSFLANSVIYGYYKRKHLNPFNQYLKNQQDDNIN